MVRYVRLYEDTEFDKYITDEMRRFFIERTNRHIALATKWANRIAAKFPEFKELPSLMREHDASKFQEPEMTPYILVTQQYRAKDKGEVFELPQEIKDKLSVSTSHHVRSNPHHPEHWSSQTDVINREDRDKAPNHIVDATKMPDMDIASMCADWMGMAEEKGNSPIDWTNKNVNKRWKFTYAQTDLIYRLINGVWH